jgi:anti-sigma factor RsiW
MDYEKLLDYVLGQLDGPRRVAVERAAAADPALAALLTWLAHRLGRLLDDGSGARPTPGPPPPPADRPSADP